MPAPWLVVHLVSVAFLAGVGWLVQVVVYPAFRLVGPAEWPSYHRRHTSRIALVIAVPWAVQGLSVVVLLVGPPRGGVVTAVGLAVLAAVPVLITIAGALPVHSRIGHVAAEREIKLLLRVNMVRAIAWTASTVFAGVLL